MKPPRRFVACVYLSLCAPAAVFTQTIQIAPVITSQPASIVVNAGQPASLTVAATGNPTPTYQWRKNGTNLSGATSSTLSIPSATVQDSLGAYTVVVTNSVGSVISNAATIRVNGNLLAITTQPANVSVTSGGNATFTAAVSANPSATFRWQRNGAAITGATGLTYTITGATSANAGTYTFVATNIVGTLTSTPATLTVIAGPPPVIIFQPSPSGVNAGGGTAKLDITADNATGFQWRKDGTNISDGGPYSGTATSNLTVTNPGYSAAGIYTAVVTNANGTVTSDPAGLTIFPVLAPTIATEPASRTVSPGASASFTVVMNPSGAPAFTYQWRKNGAPIQGATNATYSIASVTTNDAGNYTVVVANDPGPPTTPVTSANAVLTVATAPVITTQPISAAVTERQSVSFTVVATGTPAPTYQWFKGTNAIQGANGATYTIPSVATGDAGVYVVVVTNAAGSVTSSSATLAVGSAPVAPVITTHPASQTVAAGGSVTFAVSANGVPAPSYQWLKNGATISGATGSTLTLNGVQAADAASYTVRVSNSAGSTTSQAAVLALMQSPATRGRLLNLSVLTTVTASDPSFIVGTVIGGAGTSGTKALLVRAGGPSLAQLGVTDPLADPQLTLVKDGRSTPNDDWGGTPALMTAFARVGAFGYSALNSKDAAVLEPALATGDCTIQVSGVGNTSGRVIAEIYDATPNDAFSDSTPRLLNVSVRKLVAAGASLTAGFVIGGSARTVLVRAVGPTLATFNVPGVMADPQIELFNQQGARIATNDNWGGDAALAAVFTSVGAFVLPAASRDAALVQTLQPGDYTAVVSGVGNTGGAVLIEVYEAP